VGGARWLRSVGRERVVIGVRSVWFVCLDLDIFLSRNACNACNIHLSLPLLLSFSLNTSLVPLTRFFDG
jgi:hypothetical protein